VTLLGIYCLAHQHRQVVNHVLKHAGLQPELRLLVRRGSRQRGLGHHTLLHTLTHNVAQAIGHLAEGVFVLWDVFSHQPQTRCYNAHSLSQTILR
jgi:hypothetical protein